jgi:diguanylate cyclase (GGDEF)-like protein
VILPILYTYLFCKSADAKFQMTREQIRTQRQLSYLAENDVLTGLANRRRFIAELEMCCKQALPFAIMYIDLDRFKAVNDTYGHAIGDELLRAVSDRLRRTVRISDTVVRLGGDEFAVLQAAPTTEQTAQGLAERINRDLEAPFQIQELEIRIGSSIGIRFASEGYFDPDAIIRSADDALYVVKRSGRGGFAFAGGLGSLRESGNGSLAPSYGNNIAPDSKS